MTDTYACGIQMHRPTGNLYEILGLGPSEATTKAACSRGYQLKEQGLLTSDARYAWKALSDPEYSKIYEREQDTAALYRAGFFDDGLDTLAEDFPAYDPSFATTPFNKVSVNLDKVGRGTGHVVLVTTGGMAPIHDGHIAMMEEARRRLERGGVKVLGGYFAPGHDSYVGQKYGGTAAIPAVDRCAMVELATQDSDWLDCDPWAARYMPAELNFTDVVRRLSAYLQRMLGRFVRVMYVFGSDNLGFQDAMGLDGICVPRTTLSSKLAREGDHGHLDPRVRDYLLGLQQPKESDLPYLIRDEGKAALPTLAGLHDRLPTFKAAIVKAFQDVLVSSGAAGQICVMDVMDQIKKARDVVGTRKTLSLDPFFSGDARMDGTRYFAMSGSQLKPLYRGARVGFATLKEQAEVIPPGDYVLVEDDTVTGGTIATALSLLPSSVRVVDQVILSDFSDTAGKEYLDVVDLRDFIVGSSYGGLSVVTDGNLTARAPYALPYVSLRSRAKIPAPAELELSRAIWRANLELYRDSGLVIADADYGLNYLCQSLGFSTRYHIESFCQWHLESLG